MSVVLLFYRITREVNPGLANFRNLEEQQFLLGAIGGLSGKQEKILNSHLVTTWKRYFRFPENKKHISYSQYHICVIAESLCVQLSLAQS